MSEFSNREIHCPHCGALQVLELYTSITATEEPKLRQRLMDETLFAYRCGKCRYEAVFAYPCLYHDPDKGFLVYLNPSADEKKLHPDFPASLRPLKKRLVSTQEEMKEKVRVFESGFDDAAVEVVKLALVNIEKKKTGIIPEGIFFYEGGQEKLCFTVFPKKGNPYTVRNIKSDLYQQSVRLLRAINFQDNGEFLRIDSGFASWALDAFRKKQGNNR